MDIEKLNSIKITQNQHCNMVLQEYFSVLELSLKNFTKKSLNPNKKKAYIDVYNLIQEHKKQWKRQFESQEADDVQSAEKEQLQKA